MGGVLNLNTMAPDNQFHGKVGLTMAEDETYGFTARCQGPVVLFEEDGLHLSANGYEVWRKQLKEQFLDTFMG